MTDIGAPQDASSENEADKGALPSPTAVPRPEEICATCQLPLTRRGPNGGCARCLMNFAFPCDDVDSPDRPHPGEEPTEEVASRYGHFEVVTDAKGHPVKLGVGDDTTTYRAYDTVLHAAVALKIINHEVAAHPEVRARFLSEARTTAKLQHPNVARVTHYGEQGGKCYYVMELVEGETLEARVRREGPLPVPLVLDIGIQVARALAAAEACGVMHRDLKPSSIMLTNQQGEESSSASANVKVIDWGLAKAIDAPLLARVDHAQGSPLGTPALASPEPSLPATSHRIDTRSDTYSLGLTLWFLLCGRTPIVESTHQERHGSQARPALPLAQLTAVRTPTRLVALLKSMLAVDPMDRPQSARELIEALHACRGQFSLKAALHHIRRHPVRWLASSAAMILIVVCGVSAWLAYPTRKAHVSTDSSIAVLPFDNLSPNKADAFFAVGVQDEIAADLARIASLKVIGSDSTRSYAVGSRDLARIGGELGVTRLLEGSVRREGDQLRVTVRLVDLHSPAHPWENQYLRRLAEVFAVQSEITRAVADRLGVVLSEDQKAAIDEPMTSDVGAYDLYLHAREMPRAATTSSDQEIVLNAKRAIHWLDEAVTRDPKFLLAYCELVRRHDDLHFYRECQSPEDLLVDHRSLAEVALAKAARLRPDAGALHLSRANHALQVNRDPEQADIEVRLARQSLPNNAEVETIASRVARRQDRWDEAVRALERAISLEPRDRDLRSLLGRTYRYLRRYDDADRMLADIIALTPSGQMDVLPFDRAMVRTERTGDLAPLLEMLPLLKETIPDNDQRKRMFGVFLALWSRDDEALTAICADEAWAEVIDAGVAYPKEWFQAIAARRRGDQSAAAEAFAAARGKVEKEVVNSTYHGRPLSVLAIIDAGLGRKEQALAEARQACEITPLATMNLEMPIVRCNLAVVYAWTGQTDLALAELSDLIDRPGGNCLLVQPSYGDLRLNPLWDPLRNDPRFEALARRLAPPDRAGVPANH